MESTFVTLTTRIRFEASIRSALLLFCALALLLSFVAAAQGSWQSISPPPGAELLQILHMDDTLMCFDDEGDFMRSEDGGTSWSLCPMSSANVNGGATQMYAAFGRFWLIRPGRDSLYRYDRNSGWIGHALPSAVGRAYQVWALGDSVLLYSSGGLFISTDPAGLWWSDFGQGLPVRSVTALTRMRTGTPAALLCAVQGKGLYRRDSGTGWQLVSDAPESQRMQQLLHTGSALIGLVGQERIVVTSATGLQWDTLSIGGTAWISRLAMDGPVVYAASYHGLYTSVDSLQTWMREPFIEPGLNVSGIDAHDGRIALVTTNGGVHVSADAGQTWTRSDVGTMKIGSVYELDGELMVGHPLLETYFRYSGDRWVWIPAPPDPDSQFYWEHAMFAHAGWLYYQRTYLGKARSRFWRSSDKGSNWEANDTLQLPGRQVFAAEGDWVFTNGLGVYRTNDNGATWQLRVAGYKYPGQPSYVEHIAALPGHLYVAGSCWIGHSTDAGDTWLGDTLGLPGGDITGLVVTDSLVCVQMWSDELYIKRHYTPIFVRDPIVAQPPVAGVKSFFAHGADIFFLGTDGAIYRRDPDTGVWELYRSGPVPGTGGAVVGTVGEHLYMNAGGGFWGLSLAKTTATGTIPDLAIVTIEMWPQPASNRLFVRLRDGQASATLILTDLRGREYLRGNLEGGGTMLPVATLPTGVYILHITPGQDRALVRVLR